MRLGDPANAAAGWALMALPLGSLWKKENQQTNREKLTMHSATDTPHRWNIRNLESVTGLRSDSAHTVNKHTQPQRRQRHIIHLCTFLTRCKQTWEIEDSERDT